MQSRGKKSEETIPVVSTRPHRSTNDPYMQKLNLLLDQFIKKYRDRLPMRKIEIHVESPQNASGTSKEDVIIKLHITLKTGKLLMAQSERKNVTDAMKNITREIDHQTSLSDRQKHKETTRKVGDEFFT